MLSFAIDLSGKAPEPDTRRPTRAANCVRCGRFCRVVRDWLAYDGNGTQNYVTFDCSKDGVFTESMW